MPQVLLSSSAKCSGGQAQDNLSASGGFKMGGEFRGQLPSYFTVMEINGHWYLIGVMLLGSKQIFK
ncbi:hypothetical protein N9954_06240 [Maribacter sp.]|nr:hypothetical protein [Maribacter sp.]